MLIDLVGVAHFPALKAVVLQEQSVYPAMPAERDFYMYSTLRTLVPQVPNRGATSLLFLTWARRRRVPKYGIFDYESMQAQVNDGYYEIAAELHVPVVPVGSAWRLAMTEHLELRLWQNDGNHPAE